jgi:N-alpha-acetyl-L-2,4-diaminobutyrate deacetylase
MIVRDPTSYVFAPSPRLFEPYHLAARDVQQGEVVSFLHFVEDVDRPSLENCATA